MTPGQVIRRIRYWLRRNHFDAALAEELELHRHLKQQELERDGMTPDAAHFAARRALGNVTQAREDARGIWIWPWLESVWRDAAYAVRSLRRQPGFSAVAITILGLAIGLNASLFTVVIGLVFRPMPGIADPGRVVTIAGIVPERPDALTGMSFPEYRLLASAARTFVGLAAERNTSLSLEAGGVGRTTVAHAVTGNYFDLLGVRMAHGRGFRPEEDRRDSTERVVVLGHRLWQTRFGAEPAIVGTAVRINDQPHTVIGIAPPEFTGSEGAAIRIWLPISSLRSLRPHDFEANLIDRAEDCCVEVVGRLAGDVSRAQARAELQVLSDRFRASVAQDPRPIALGGTEFLRDRAGASTALAVIGVLFLGIVLVLVMACANVGNLLLARMAARTSEIAVRLSLGGDRPRIVRQLLTEGLVLAVVASAVGLAIAQWLPGIVLDTLAGQPAPFDTRPDAIVLMYAIALAAIACVACALAPALHATRRNVATSLKIAPTATASRLPLRSLLLGVQVAVSVVLLTSAGLLLRGVAEARRVDLGFDVEDVTVAAIDLPQGSYDPARMHTFMADLTGSLRNAGLRSFGFVTTEPLSDLHYMTGVRLPGSAPEAGTFVEFLQVSPGYFDVLGIPLIEGRPFVDADASRSVAIVNQALARRYWPDDTAVGRSFVTGNNRVLEIIGVVRDAHVVRFDAVEPMFFQLPSQLRADAFPRLLFSADQPSTSALVATAIERLEGRAQVEIVPLRDRLEGVLSELAFAPLAASALGVFALGLATVGMFGVFAYAVRQRTREIGVRLALGAQPREVVRLVLATSARAVTGGLAAGILGALAASQVLRSSLYGVSPIDPLTYGAVSLVLAASALAASYLPARLAARIDPGSALRAE
jgi:predicted permease